MDDWGRRLAKGDPAALAELYDRCADRIYHYLLVEMRCPHEAADVLQETFLRTSRHRGRLAMVANIEGYLFTVARNACRDRQSRGDFQSALSLNAESLFVFDPHDAEGACEAAEFAAAALERLDADRREVVVLKIYAGLGLREIAEVIGCPQGTVATRYRTAIEKLRNWARQRS